MAGYKHDAKGRSTGRLAGRLGRLNKPPSGENWSWETRPMLESVAFRCLSINARRALDRIKLEHLAHGGTENGALIVTYDNFAAFGVSRRCIHDAICELRFFGIIRFKSGKTNGSRRPPNMFYLTWLPDKTGAPATNEWKGITTEQASVWKEKQRLKNSQQSKRKAPVFHLMASEKERQKMADPA